MSMRSEWRRDSSRRFLVSSERREGALPSLHMCSPFFFRKCQQQHTYCLSLSPTLLCVDFLPASDVSKVDMSGARDKWPPEVRDWWEKTLRNPKCIVAPMVDASELPWRMLSRRYNADLCFTPMLHSRIFTEDPKYQQEHLYNDIAEEDRPLIVQFCGNDADVMVKAAMLAKPYCDGIDLNLGCPQKIAKNGHYGAFLMDEWELIVDIVRRIRKEVQVPISCKIRIFPDVKKTIAYAKTLEEAGCYMLTVHGRTREQKGRDTGIADWSYIKAVREAVNIPVVANGNIQYLPDVDRCIAEIGVNGVMSAEGNLYNPKLFAGINPPAWEVGLEYLDLVEKYPCPLGYARGHIFKMYHHLLTLAENSDIRQVIGSANTFEELREQSYLLKARFEAYYKGEKAWVVPESNPEVGNLPFPPYICQPYVRPKPVNSNDQPISHEVTDEHPSKKRKISLPENILASLPPGIELSNNKIKKMSKKPFKNWAVERTFPSICTVSSCVNPQGQKCAFQMCRKCCRNKCYDETLDCVGHKTLTKTFRERKSKINSEQCDAVTSDPSINKATCS